MPYFIIAMSIMALVFGIGTAIGGFGVGLLAALSIVAGVGILIAFLVMVYQ